MDTLDQSKKNYEYLEKGLYLTSDAMDTPLVETNEVTMVG
jgi:hypothetical protein